MILPNLGSGSASQVQYAFISNFIFWDSEVRVDCAARSRPLIFDLCRLLWQPTTYVGVLLHDALGGPWGIVMGSLDSMYYNLPNQSIFKRF